MLNVLDHHFRSSIETQPTAASETSTKGKQKHEVFAVIKVKLSVFDDELEVVYGDTENKDCPVALGLHGGAATHKAFNRVAAVLVEQGYRVIAPNMPGMGLTPVPLNGQFDYTTTDKVVLVKALIKALKIDRISLLFGHSMGGHVAVHLAAQKEMQEKIQSLCLFASAGQRPHSTLQPFDRVSFMGKFLHKVSQEPQFYDDALKALKMFDTLKMRRTLEGNLYLNAVKSVASYDFPQFQNDLPFLKTFPVLIIGCEEDEVIDFEIQADTAKGLGIEESQTRWYKDERLIGGEFAGTELRRAVFIKGGDHYPHFSQIHLIKPQLVQFLHAVRGSNECNS